MRKKIFAIFLSLTLLCQGVSFGAKKSSKTLFRVVTVKREIVTTSTSSDVESGTSGWGAAGGGITAGLIWGGPVAVIGGAWLGDHLEKEKRGRRRAETTTSESHYVFTVRFDDGRTIRSTFEYRIGNLYREEDIINDAD
jgi:hypothetical protein